LLLADEMALYARPAFDAAAKGQPLALIDAWGGALSYSFQLYFDFSAYSDMAIGISLLFGIKLPLNFNSPCVPEACAVRDILGLLGNSL
jgi:alginate O-acetyltransferase complex protein AlgI